MYQLIAIFLLAFSFTATADTPPARAVNSQTYNGAGTQAITATVEGGKTGLDEHNTNTLSDPVLQSIVVGGSVIDPTLIRALTTSDQISCQQLGTWNVGNITGSVTLPTNAAKETGGNLASIVTNTSTASTNQTNGGQKTQLVNASNTEIGGAIKTDLDKLPADPAREGGNLATVVTNTANTKTSVDTVNTTLGTTNSTLSTVQTNTSNTATNTSGIHTDTTAIAASTASTVTNTATIDTDVKASQPRKMQDGAGNPLTSQTSGAQRALDIGINVSGTQVDPRAIRALTSSDVVSAAQSGVWTAGRTWSLLNTTDSVNAVQSGTWTVQQGSAPWSVSQSGAWNINNITGTVTLPTGASTSAKQPALGTAGTPSADVITVQGATSMTPVKTDGSATTQPVSAVSLPLPANAAQETGGNLASINTKTPSLGQAASASSSPVVIASDQSSIPITAATKPSLQFLDTNNVLDSSSTNIPATASATLTVVASLNQNVKRMRVHDETGKFIDLYEGATLRAVITPGEDDYQDVTMSSGSAVKVRADAINSSAITSGFLFIDFR